MASRSERVLITGGTGFTGGRLAVQLRKSGHEVIALCLEGGAPNTVTVDLRDFDGLERALLQTNPGAIVHLAGIAAPSHDKLDEIYSANVLGTANLFAALAASKVKPRIVIVASSATVYAAGNADSPISEDAPLAPKSHYAISKYATEQIAGIYSNHFQITVVRPFNYTGPGQSSHFLVPKIVQHYAERRGEIRLGNLDLIRDFSDVERVTEAYARLLAPSIKPTTVNICSGRPIHLRSILAMMEDLSGHRLKVVTEANFLREDEPRVVIGSPSRLEALVGALPNPEFRETLRRMYDQTLERRSAI